MSITEQGELPDRCEMCWRLSLPWLRAAQTVWHRGEGHENRDMKRLRCGEKISPLCFPVPSVVATSSAEHWCGHGATAEWQNRAGGCQGWFHQEMQRGWTWWQQQCHGYTTMELFIRDNKLKLITHVAYNSSPYESSQVPLIYPASAGVAPGRFWSGRMERAWVARVEWIMKSKIRT